MRLLQNLPLKSKLTVINMLTSGAALLLTCAVFIAYDQVSFRRIMTRELEITAQIIGANSASSLSFEDNESATLTLKSLAAQPHIVRSCVYNAAGKVFATYRKDPKLDRAWPAPRQDHATLGEDSLELFHVIRFANESIGTIYLQSDLLELHNRRGRYIATASAVLLAAMLITWLIASRLQRVISEPVLQLATIASQVATERDYSVRAIKQSDDEVGRLFDGFNNMLAQIQARDADLQASHATLEKRVEERTTELSNSLSLLNATLDSTADGILAIRFSGEVVCTNSQFTAMWGMPPDLPTKEGDAGIIAFVTTLMKDPERFRRRVDEILEHPETEAFDMLELKDGRTFERYVKPQQLDGRIVGLVLNFRDITVRKRAQEAAAREQERLKFIFDASPMGIALATENHDGRVLRMINESHLRICGLTREEADVPANFTRINHPGDLARQQLLTKELEEGRINQFSIEKRYLRPDGRITWVVFSMKVRRYEDGCSERLTTVVDITDLKRAQEEAAREYARFKFIFESAPVGISWCMPDVEGSHMVNPAHQRITGLSAAEAMLPDALERATHPDDHRNQSELIEKYLRGEIDRYSIERRYLHPDGRVVWVVLTSHMSVDPATGGRQSVTTLMDITERKQTELELENVHKQLLATSRQAGMAEVATSVLHNVGNVLNSVNVSATLVADQVRRSKVTNVGKLSDLLNQNRADLGNYLTNDPKGRIIPTYLATLTADLTKEQTTILSELDSLHKNIGHIKDIVAMQQSYAKTSGVVETISVPDLIEDALRMNAGSLARHDVDIAREYHTRTVLTLDKNKALQILVNLMRNAKYACDESGRTDKLLTIRTTADAHGVTISVIDNGVGIPTENLTRIFAHGFTTRKHGHGFGLHSGALAAKELGGSLIAHSDGPGKGATFVLKLPYKPDSPTL